MPSRRTVLAGVSALALGAGGVGVSSRIHVDAIESWSPGSDTWPLSRHDPANTAANPDASAPTDPEVSWGRTVLGPTVDTALVVGRDAVYASDVTYTDSITAFDRRDGSIRWTHEPSEGQFGGYLALYDGALFAAAESNLGNEDIHAFEAADGAVRWRAEYAPGGADHVVAADGTVFVGGGGGLGAYDADDGTRRWGIGGSDQHPAGVAVHDEGLYAMVGDRVLGLRSRSLLDAVLRRPPPLSWQTDPIGEPCVPAVAGDRIVVGSRVETGGEGSEPAIAAYDAATGERIWGAFPSDTVADPPGESAFEARTPAIVGDRGIAPLEFEGEFESGSPDWKGDHPGEHGLAAVSLADGSVLWRRAVDRRVRDVAAADVVVVGTGDQEGGSVVALDPADGSELWRVEFGYGVSSVAVVDGAVFAATVDGGVVALR